MQSSVKLHDRLFKCLVRAPMAFFDGNPIGMLLNRCSRDMGIIDDLLPSTFFDTLSLMLLNFGVAILICVIDPWILIPTGVLIAIFYMAHKLYVGTARNIKRLGECTFCSLNTHS